MENINSKQVIKYVALPGLKPRIKQLLGGFSFFTTLMAQIYAMVGLLPKNHPYLAPSNAGRFKIHHVIAEAANNLEISKKNFDKIFIFFALLIGAALLFLQFIFLFGAVFINFAWAIPSITLFDTVTPQTDVAFNIMGRVFGIPDLFCSSSAPTTCANINASLPFPMHSGLHALLRFYSYGLLLVGTLIFLYFVVVVVAETATTGSPFGQRFQNVWVPIRLVMAIGLLIPINYGLNSGQYIALYAAKLGSSLATNGWLDYNDGIASHNLFASPGKGQNPTGELQTLIGVPNAPSMTEIIEAMSIIHTCAYTYWITDDDSSKPNFNSGNSYMGTSNKIKPYFVKSSAIVGGTGLAANINHSISASTDIADALSFFGNNDIVIAFGEVQDTSKDPGQVVPFCGKIRIPVNSIHPDYLASTNKDQWITDNGGSMYVLRFYFNMVRDLWFTNAPLREAGIRFYEVTINKGLTEDPKTNSWPSYACQVGCGSVGFPNCTYSSSPPPKCTEYLPTNKWSSSVSNNVQGQLESAILFAWNGYVQNGANIEIETSILERGWGGAGMWFNRLAELNGNFAQSVYSSPEIISYPKIMEQVREAQLKILENPSKESLFNPAGNTNSELHLPGKEEEKNRAKVLYEIHNHWNTDQGGHDNDIEKYTTYNVFTDAMNMIIGTDSILDMRGLNAQTHPLSQLILVGKGLVDSTVKNLASATGSSFLGGALTAAGAQYSGPLASAIGGFYSQTAFIGLTAGIVLFYIVPFLPFVYFFFAVGTWIKTIFEAMVGVPLWALAHLRIDGEGLPGESASNGYFLILEIGIRPILIVFGLVASIIIFTAQVRVLHFIWDIVINNAAGFDNDNVITLGQHEINKYDFKRSTVDQFFFTVIYAIIVYMLATASFKLIDSIPNTILRWSGAGVSAFGDQNQDALDSLQRYVAKGGMIQGQQITQGVTSAAGQIGQTTPNALGLGGVLGGRRPGINN